MYDFPTQPTVRLESPTKFTTGELVNYPKHTYRHNVRSTMRTIDRMVDRYIVLKTSREIY